MNYIVNHIPRETQHKRRQGIIIQPSTITIHGTANVNSGAMSERNWLVNPDNSREASFHLVVDENSAVECIPLNEKAIHAGDTIGNMTSIGCEICESGNRQKTLQNAAELVAKLLKERGWGIDHLRRHHDWSGKNCPRIFNEDGKWSGWVAFKKMVQELLKPKEQPKLSKQEALVIVQGLQKCWPLASNKSEQQAIHTAANAVRKLAGIPTT